MVLVRAPTSEAQNMLSVTRDANDEQLEQASLTRVPRRLKPDGMNASAALQGCSIAAVPLFRHF